MRRIVILLFVALVQPGFAAIRGRPNSPVRDETDTTDSVINSFRSNDVQKAIVEKSNDQSFNVTFRVNEMISQNQLEETVLTRAKHNHTVIQVTGRGRSDGASVHITRNDTLDDIEVPDAEEQIVGGTSTTIGSFPFFVHGANPTDNTRICGGVLVHPDIFLTSASCQNDLFMGERVFIRAINLLSTLG